MALTQKKIEDLEDKDFDTLYDQHSELWKKMVATAKKHAKENITEGNEPRPDDIAKALYPSMEVNKILRAHQDENKARGKRYIEWFVEYVIDKAA